LIARLPEARERLDGDMKIIARVLNVMEISSAARVRDVIKKAFVIPE